MNKKQIAGIVLAAVISLSVFAGVILLMYNTTQNYKEREYIPVTVTITHADITKNGARVLSFTSDEYSDSLAVTRETYAKYAVGDEMIIWKYVNGFGQTEYCIKKPN